MQQGMNTLEIDRMAPQAQGIETLGSMEEVPMVPEGGIQAAVPDATRMLADAGRHGDIYVVHASEGETVVPKEVLEGPGGQQIRESLFRQMEQMGVDPGRYVVGNELNSVNPETGLPEFFFKKAFKKLKGFFKKAAPIILPIALNFLLPGLGTIAAGAIGAGLGSLIQGGDAKDALKAAAFGGITAGIMSGASGVLGGQTFGEGVQSGLPSTMGGGSTVPFIGEGGGPGESPVSVFDTPDATTLPKANGTAFKPIAARPTSHGSDWLNPDTLNSASYDALPSVNAIPERSYLTPTQVKAQYNWPVQTGGGPRLKLRGSGQSAAALRAGTPPRLAAASARPQVSTPGGPYDPTFLATKPNVVTADVSGGTTEKIVASRPVQQAPPPLDKGFINRWTGDIGVGDYVSPELGGTPIAAQGQKISQQLTPQLNIIDDQMRLYASTKGTQGINPTVGSQIKAGLIKDANVNYRQYLGPLALAGIGAYAGGFFDEPEQEEFQSKFERIPQSKIDPLRIDIRPPPPPEAPIQFSTFAAHGGEMQRDFPRRNGAISGPGTGTSDDVPAMLSDGEFVMTAQAVRGAGNGSRRQGVENLYNLMRNFEATV